MNTTGVGMTCLVGVHVLLNLLLAAGCTPPDHNKPEPVTATVLSYREQEAGVQPYPLRILVNEKYLRFDDGTDGSDYMLMDRASGSICSVNHDDRSILVIPVHAAARPPPADLRLTEERQSDASAPPIAGKQPLYIRFLANGSVCYQAVVVPGLLEEVSAALAEYAIALGNRQFSEMASLPEEMRTPCLLSRHVFSPARHLRDGLPVQEWDESGYRRMLVDYRGKQIVDPSVFRLPEGYEQFQPGE